MDQQTGVRLSIADERLNSIEGDDHVLEVGLVDFQRQIRRRQGAGNGDRPSLYAGH